jgi:zinc transport system permease protein
VAVVCFLIGISGSFVYDMPTGASVVIVNIAAFFLFWGAAFLRSRRFFVRRRGGVIPPVA